MYDQQGTKKVTYFSVISIHCINVSIQTYLSQSNKDISIYIMKKLVNICEYFEYFSDYILLDAHSKSNFSLC